jgi:hypothetical protein
VRLARNADILNEDIHVTYEAFSIELRSPHPAVLFRCYLRGHLMEILLFRSQMIDLIRLSDPNVLMGGPVK